MKRLLIIAAALTVAACESSRTPQESRPASTNASYQVDLLFIHEGVRMYRFYDAGEYRYYAVPNSGAPAEAMGQRTDTETVNCGKDCTTTETHVYTSRIPTLPEGR